MVLQLGVAVHYERNLTFFSDSSGTVYQMSMEDHNTIEQIYKSSAHPSSLSIDWLNHKLYIAENSKVRLPACNCSVSLQCFIKMFKIFMPNRCVCSLFM